MWNLKFWTQKCRSWNQFYELMYHESHPVPDVASYCYMINLNHSPSYILQASHNTLKWLTMSPWVVDTFCPLFTWIHHLFSTTHNQHFQQVVKLDVFVVLLIGIPHIESCCGAYFFARLCCEYLEEWGWLSEELGH